MRSIIISAFISLTIAFLAPNIPWVNYYLAIGSISFLIIAIFIAVGISTIEIKTGFKGYFISLMVILISATSLLAPFIFYIDKYTCLIYSNVSCYSFGNAIDSVKIWAFFATISSLIFIVRYYNLLKEKNEWLR